MGGILRTQILQEEDVQEEKKIWKQEKALLVSQDPMLTMRTNQSPSIHKPKPKHPSQQTPQQPSE